MDDVGKISDLDRAVATIVLAFGADPFVRWLLPDGPAYFTTFLQVARLHGERTAAHGGAFEIDGGAALWYPPGIHPDAEALGAIFEGSGARDRLMQVWPHVAAFEPEVPHWYLRIIAVDPARQGAGLGGRLLEACLADVDADGGTAYLEATSAASRRLYERYGFSTLGEVRGGDSPPLWPMVRAPR